MSFNKTHPELLEGEAFLMNTASMERTEEFPLKFKSVRRGDYAYNTKGNICKGLKPFFISKQEIKERGVPDKCEWSQMIGILFNREYLKQTKKRGWM